MTSVPVLTLWQGPKLAHNEKGVHIIRLVAESHETGSASPHITVKPVKKNAGSPAPTDVLVFDHRPWHLARGHMHAHPQAHHSAPETILELSISKGERAVWWSEEKFQIESIARSPHDPTTGPAADYPFAAKVETREESDAAGQTIFVARSSVPVDRAKNHLYKISFSTEGDHIDPDMHCMP